MRQRPGSVYRFLLLCALAAIGSATLAEGPVKENAEFPRLMGMNIGAKNYQDPEYQNDLARLDVVILGFYRGWQPAGYAPTSTLAIRKVVQALKAQNPRILVGQYTILGEAYDDPKDAASLDLRDKINANNWWLRNASGEKVQWTGAFSSWDVNFTAWTRPDPQGQRWPEWLAERNYAVFFRNVPEFDMVFLDGVMSPARVTADWNLDGVDEDRSSPEILAARYAGHASEWKRLRELLPKALLIGNTDNDLGNPQWRNQLDGAFLEAQMGLKWSLEARAGWQAMMDRYRKVLHNTRPPGIVGFNVFGRPTDYRFFRYAYASCLLDDGYFSFTDTAKEYSSVPWFDEYDYKLGKALGGPPRAAWKDGVWRRDFQAGVVLVNPTSSVKTIELEPGLRRLAGRQDPAVNDGAVASKVTLASKDGIMLRRVVTATEPTR